MAATYLARLRKTVWAHDGNGIQPSAQRAPARSRGAARQSSRPLGAAGSHRILAEIFKSVSDTLTTAHGRSQQGLCGGEGALLLPASD